MSPTHALICSQYGVYSTKITKESTCDILKRNYQIRNIDSPDGGPTVKVLYSPGIELSPPIQ